MTALVRYQAGVLLRSHRWVGPVAVYAMLVWLVASGGGSGREQLGSGLGWSAAALLPMVAWLTRSMLTAEPAESRACVAAAGGPHRVHLAALVTAVAAGAVLGLGGVLSALITCQPPKGATAYAGTLATGLAAMLICIGVGSIIGALCNPPVIRGATIAVLTTIGAVIAALVANISPANAAIKDAQAAPRPAGLPVGPLLALVIALIALSWAISTLVAARRGT